jgi:hypothetical protein
MSQDGNFQEFLQVLQQLFAKLLIEAGWKELCQV